MRSTKAQRTLGKGGQKDVVLGRRSHYRRLLCRIEDLEDALDLDRAEHNSIGLLAYAEVRERLKRVGRL